MNNLSTAIALRIKELLEEKQMSRYALCMKAGIPCSTMKSIIKGQTKGVSVKTLVLIAYGLDMTLSEFLNSNLFKYSNLNLD